MPVAHQSGFLQAQHGTALQSLTPLLLLAQAAVFVSTTPKAVNQIFNVSNGDVFRWSEVGSHTAMLPQGPATVA